MKSTEVKTGLRVVTKKGLRGPITVVYEWSRTLDNVKIGIEYAHLCTAFVSCHDVSVDDEPYETEPVLTWEIPNDSFFSPY